MSQQPVGRVPRRFVPDEAGANVAGYPLQTSYVPAAGPVDANRYHEARPRGRALTQFSHVTRMSSPYFVQGPEHAPQPVHTGLRTQFPESTRKATPQSARGRQRTANDNPTPMSSSTDVNRYFLGAAGKGRKHSTPSHQDNLCGSTFVDSTACVPGADVMIDAPTHHVTGNDRPLRYGKRPSFTAGQQTMAEAPRRGRQASSRRQSLNLFGGTAQPDRPIRQRSAGPATARLDAVNLFAPEESPAFSTTSKTDESSRRRGTYYPHLVHSGDSLWFGQGEVVNQQPVSVQRGVPECDWKANQQELIEHRSQLREQRQNMRDKIFTGTTKATAEPLWFAGAAPPPPDHRTPWDRPVTKQTPPYDAQKVTVGKEGGSVRRSRSSGPSFGSTGGGGGKKIVAAGRATPTAVPPLNELHRELHCLQQRQRDLESMLAHHT